jgi:prepilin-type processing-associated H-X9-DG protein
MDRQRGLTWLDVVMIIFLLVVVGLLVIPEIPDPRTRERALRSQCASNLHMIGLALIQYAEDNGGAFPAVAGVVKATKDHPGFARPGDGAASLKLLYPDYVSDTRIFQCPTTPPGTGEFSSFAYDPRHQTTDPPNVVIVGDRGGGAKKNSPNHDGDGQNVLFIDGHAAWKKTTNCGVGGDEIFVQNDELNNRDSWLIE